MGARRQDTVIPLLENHRADQKLPYNGRSAQSHTGLLRLPMLAAGTLIKPLKRIRRDPRFPVRVLRCADSLVHAPA